MSSSFSVVMGGVHRGMIRQKMLNIEGVGDIYVGWQLNLIGIVINLCKTWQGPTFLIIELFKRTHRLPFLREHYPKPGLQTWEWVVFLCLCVASLYLAIYRGFYLLLDFLMDLLHKLYHFYCLGMNLLRKWQGI